MSVKEEADGTIAFRSRRTVPPMPDASYVATYRSLGNPVVPAANSRTAFLRNRDTQFLRGRNGRIQKMMMLHDPWQVEQLDPAVTRIQVNTVLRAAGLELPTVPFAVDFTREIASVGFSAVDADEA
jgi:uncharacterized protein YqjF (DUF2071 family)